MGGSKSARGPWKNYFKGLFFLDRPTLGVPSRNTFTIFDWHLHVSFALSKNFFDEILDDYASAGRVFIH